MRPVWRWINLPNHTLKKHKIMSNKKKVNRKRRRSPWYKMFAKTETRLSARVTSEEDWQTDVPNIRLSRAFVIVLLMHLVVGGAIIAFTLMNPSEAQAQTEATPTKQKSEKKDKVAKVVTKSEIAQRSVQEQDRLDDMRRHIVHSGDSVSKIASQYGVSTEEIHAVNRIDELYQLYQGRVLRIPVSASKPVDLNPRMADTKANTNGNNFVKAKGSRVKGTIIPHEEKVEIKATSDLEKIDRSLLPKTVDTVKRPIVIEEVVKAKPVVRNDDGIVRPRENVRKPAPEVKKKPSSGKTYVVKKGDNPFRIAKRYGVHYKELLRHNGISDPSKLQIGATLNIPN